MIHLSLSLHDAQEQACDVPSSILVGKSGVAKSIKDASPKVMYASCLGHYLNLSVNSVNTVSKCMKDFMEECLEMIKLIKHSPKQEASLEGLKLGETVESVSHEDLESNIHG